VTVEWKHNHPGYSNCPRCVKRIRELEDRIQVLLHCDIAELKARIALMEQATCDFCGHAFYALEADG